MERLTHKDDKGIYLQLPSKEKMYFQSDCSFMNAYYARKFLSKVCEFEDFMESLGLEDLEELEHLIGYPRFVDGYDEQGNEINRTEFVTYKESFNEVFEKNKKLKQENRVLKDRWQELKEWCKENCYYVEECCGDVESEDYEEYVYRYINIAQLFEKLQELEQGVNNV